MNQVSWAERPAKSGGLPAEGCLCIQYDARVGVFSNLIRIKEKVDFWLSVVVLAKILIMLAGTAFQF